MDKVWKFLKMSFILGIGISLLPVFMVAITLLLTLCASGMMILLSGRILEKAGYHDLAEPFLTYGSYLSKGLLDDFFEELEKGVENGGARD